MFPPNEDPTHPGMPTAPEWARRLESKVDSTYRVTLVLHDRVNDISKQVERHDEFLTKSGLKAGALTGGVTSAVVMLVVEIVRIINGGG